MQLVNNATQTNTWASTQHVDFDGGAFDEGSIQLVYTDATTGAKTFVDANVGVVANTITITTHGQYLGSKVAATTTGTLPGGLSATNYWVIVVDANTIQLASSLANAAAGTAVDITSAAGGGTHTLTPAALVTTGAVAKLQVSNDGTNFADVTSATVTITVAGNSFWPICIQATGAKLRPKTLRVLFTPTTGTVALSVIPCFFKDK